VNASGRLWEKNASKRYAKRLKRLPDVIGERAGE
jgi:hypothetical protein